jgi:uncharacterized protein (TIGR03435 family)
MTKSLVSAAGLAFLTGLLSVSEVHAQTATPPPQFEVASVKLDAGCDAPGRRGRGMRRSPGQLEWECVTLAVLIQNAYGAFADPSKQNAKRVPVSGAPAWIQSERYSLIAKSEGNTPVSQMLGPMLRRLLEDRFALKVRRETREAPVYELTVAKGGPKVKQTPEGSCVPLDLNRAPQASPQVPARMPGCGAQRMMGTDTVVTLNFVRSDDGGFGRISHKPHGP